MNTILRYLLYFVSFAIAVAAMSLAIAFPVNYLWNWLMPKIFGLPELSYWESFGAIWLFQLLLPSSWINQQKE